MMHRSLHSYLSQPWAILPQSIASIVDECRGDILPGSSMLPTPTIAPRYYSFDGEPLGNRGTTNNGMSGAVAVVPIAGPMTRKGYAGFFSSAPGTADVERLLKRLDNDPNVSAIVLEIDSPGGAVPGTPELSSTIYDIRRRGRTKTATVADSVMASAAIWTGTATDYVAAIPSAIVGSIGVISVYSDYSRALTEAGVDVSVMRTPAGKARFTGVEPLTDSMKQKTEQDIARIYDAFVEDVSRNRGVSIQHVRSRFGGGETMDAQQAADVGMIDAVDTLEGVISRMRSTNKRKAV